MEQIKPPQFICWVFSVSYFQKILYLTRPKTQITIMTHLSNTKLALRAIYYFKSPLQRLNKAKSLIPVEHQLIRKVWDKQRGLTKISTLKGRGTGSRTGERNLFESIPLKHLEGETNSQLSVTKADNSDWVKMSIVRIIHGAGVVVQW